MTRVAGEGRDLSDSLTMSAPSELLSTADVAEQLGISRGLVYQWVKRGRLPQPDVKTAYRPVWRAGTIRRWIEAGKHEARTPGPTRTDRPTPGPRTDPGTPIPGPSRTPDPPLDPPGGSPVDRSDLAGHQDPEGPDQGEHPESGR